MKATEQTIQQLDRVIKKVAQKFPPSESPTLLTDLHWLVSQESGEIRVYDDEEHEVTRCVVEQWIDNKDEDFYVQVTAIMRKAFTRHHALIDEMGLLKPFSMVLEDDDHENVAELYVADDDTLIIGGDLMENLESDLDDFLSHLLKD